MPLRNRVTPFGTIEALPGRGTIMGNRGVIHNAQREIVRPWQVKRWIACVLEFRGRHREVMQPNRWTELFFLDEAAAFAAGHRPCAECRRSDYKRFVALWSDVLGGSTRADDIDVILHQSRTDGKQKRTYHEKLGSLPDGTYVAIDGGAWLIHDGSLHRWSDGGYVERAAIERERITEVLTPQPFVALFSAGYAPGIHASAG